jgi:hypothetical protein
MKLIGLDEPIVNFEKEAIKSKDEKGNVTPISRRTALLNCLGSMKTENGKEAIEVFKLGSAIAEKTETDKATGISAENLILLKKAVEQNKPEYFTMIQGQLLEYLNGV